MELLGKVENEVCGFIVAASRLSPARCGRRGVIGIIVSLSRSARCRWYASTIWSGCLFCVSCLRAIEYLILGEAQPLDDYNVRNSPSLVASPDCLV